MHINERSKIEELLSAYLDDMLSNRRRTEVRRLVRNDPEAAAMLARLEKQTRLLNSMPIATAPAGTARSALAAAKAEAQMWPAVSMPVSSREGQRQLYIRRVLTIAAMLFIPAVILGLVVWTIVGPPDGPGAEYVVRTDSPSEPLLPGAVSFPLVSSLYLKTSQPVAMDSFIHKAIYKHDLTNYATVEGSGGGERTWKISSDRERIVAFLGELSRAWDQCETTAMTVHGRTMAVYARIENVRPEQAVALYQGNVLQDPVQIARNMGEMNRLMQGVPDYGTRLPVMPELTSGVRRPVSQEKPESRQGHVTLYVNIRGR